MVCFHVRIECPLSFFQAIETPFQYILINFLNVRDKYGKLGAPYLGRSSHLVSIKHRIPNARVDVVGEPYKKMKQTFMSTK